MKRIEIITQLIAANVSRPDIGLYHICPEHVTEAAKIADWIIVNDNDNKFFNGREVKD